MKIKDLKRVLSTLTDEQLDGELIVRGLYTTNVVSDIKPAETNLYWDGDDDNFELITEDEMKAQVEEECEDTMPDPYIKKGEIILHI